MNITPTPKVTAAVITGAIVTILIWIVQTIWRITVPGEVGAAFTTVLSFAVSWFAPHSRR